VAAVIGLETNMDIGPGVQICLGYSSPSVTGEATLIRGLDGILRLPTSAERFDPWPAHRESRPIVLQQDPVAQQRRD